MIKDNKIKKIAIHKDFDILFKLYKILIVTLAGIIIFIICLIRYKIEKLRKSKK